MVFDAVHDTTELVYDGINAVRVEGNRNNGIPPRHRCVEGCIIADDEGLFNGTGIPRADDRRFV